jgi:mannosyltransferase OCH1-like enzyme
MDTDMLVLKPLDRFLEHRAFAGFEDKEMVNFALWGSEAGHPFLRRFLDRYDSLSFDRDNLAKITIPQNTTQVLRQQGLVDYGHQQIDGVDLYSTEYFYPWPFLFHQDRPDYREFVTPETVAVHLWNHSWNPGIPLRKRVVFTAKRVLPVGVWNIVKRMKSLLYH